MEALQAPPSMEFSRQEYWSGLPLPTPGDLPKPEIKRLLSHLHCQADFSPLCHLGSPVSSLGLLKTFYLGFLPTFQLSFCCCCCYVLVALYELFVYFGS